MTDVIEYKSVYEVVQAQEHDFSKVLCTDEVTWSKECQFAMQLLEKNDYLRKVAWGNQGSLRNAIINIASIGISLNPVLKYAYLVPRDGGVCLDVSYMGLLHIAVKGGGVLWGQAKIVYLNDNYINKGLDQQPEHTYNAFTDRGDPVGVYCTVKLTDGSYLTEEMSKEEIHKIRERSQAYTRSKKGPWVTDELEMWRKTVVKRGSKYWPEGDGRLEQAIAVVNEHEGIDFDAEKEAQGDKQYADDPYKEQFHKLVEEEDALEFVLMIRAIGEDRYNNLYNSGAKGEKVALKEACKVLERSGGLAFNELLQYIDDGEDYKFKETAADMSELAKKHLFFLLSALQKEVVKLWYQEDEAEQPAEEK